jgi:uncharacterized integral membrane protein
VEADAAASTGARGIGSVGSWGRVWLWTSLLLTLVALTTAAVLSPTGDAVPVRSLTLLIFVGSSVHVAATGYLFTEADVRAHVVEHRARYLWTPVVLVLLAASLAAVVSVGDLKWLLLPYFAWQFFHFHKQNLGMVALGSTSAGLRGPSAPERRAMSAASLFGIVGLLAHPGLLQLSDQTPLRPFYVVALLAFICGVVWGVALVLVRPRSERSVGVTATYLMALLFFAPVFVFRSPYAAVGGMTIGHGLQYLLLVGLVAAGRCPGRGRVVGLALLFNLALLGGVLLSTASHLHDAPALGRGLFGAYLGVVMAHFVIDAGIWRLSEPFPRAFMASRVPFLVRPMVQPSFGDRS